MTTAYMDGNEAAATIAAMEAAPAGPNSGLADTMLVKYSAGMPCSLAFCTSGVVPSARSVLLARGLRERGVLVRAFAGLPRELEALAASNGEALRIGIGPWETMQAVLDALDAMEELA